jgi:hypothetical protein
MTVVLVCYDSYDRLYNVIRSTEYVRNRTVSHKGGDTIDLLAGFPDAASVYYYHTVTICPVWSCTSTSGTLASVRASVKWYDCSNVVAILYDSGKILLGVGAKFKMKLRIVHEH